MKAEEAIIVKNIRSGNSAVFESIYLEYYSRLVQFAYGFLFDQRASEGVVQDLFMTLWERHASLSINVSIASYLFASTKNQCLKELRKLKIQDRNNLLYIQSLLDDQLNEQNPSDGVKEDLLSDLAKAIAILPEQMKKIILLKYEGHKKLAEISQLLGISQNTVKTQLQRGKSKIRQFMSESRNLNLIL